MAEDNERTPEGTEAPDTAAAAAAEAEAAAAAEATGAEDLARQLDEAQAKAAEYLDGWQRARAEFANYKRRVEKEQGETAQQATARVIARFLEIYDDFERAMQELPADTDNSEAMAQWAAGVGLIQRKLQNLLDAEGVTRIEAEGQMFDPQLHEAVTHEDSDGHEPGEIIGVVRQGYRLGDRVIRPAMVRVAK